jgi:hypothetical protein
LSGEVFTLVLEPVFDEMPLMPKQGLGALSAVGDVESYTNWQDENSKEAARIAIRAAAERCKDPRNYGPNDGYSNISSIQDGIGASFDSATVERARIESLKQKRLGAR